jgi:hypothetical protein
MQVVYEVNPEVWSADKEESKPDDGPKSGDVDNRQPNTTEGVRETFCQYLEGIDPELRAEVRKSGQSSCGMILNSAKAVLRCTVE